ncbi:porin family protein [Larkinella rosea]|uniref:PorT family protein n=1 Tax=Larkinella rosea TaxID=2025312 RepID=A0A3P1BNG9_9BACT|nr:porin family protein [Larkinella rosea]RRB02598.1 PorT family protein [Larkinella rosea]
MKNLLLMGLGWLLSAGLADAQVPENMDYGVTIGLGATMQNEAGPKTDGVHYNPGLGLRAGGFVRYHFNDAWALQTGLEFAGLNASVKFNGDKTRTSLFSLVVPIQAVYTLPVTERRWMVSAGPAFRINASGKVKGDFGSTKMEFGKDKGNRRLVPGLQMGVRYQPNFNLRSVFSRKKSLTASLNPFQSAGGGDDVVLGVDGTVLEWDYVNKQYKKKYKDGWWEIMLRIAWNFATNQRGPNPQYKY